MSKMADDRNVSTRRGKFQVAVALCLLICELIIEAGCPPVVDPTDDFLGINFKTGYFDIGKERGKMFYWYFPSTIESPPGDLTVPTMMWLTGGPGCASEIAVFQENGPFWVNADGTLRLSQSSWNAKANMLYVDQPLGTGFSIVSDSKSFVHDEHGVAEDLAQFLEQFLMMYPSQQNRPFFISGESYAGHYIPAVAHYLTFVRKIDHLNLQGMAIGNGWVDPYVQYPANADFAFENGLINKAQYQLAQKAFVLCDKLIKNRLWPLAFAECTKVSSMLIGDRNPYDIRLPCENPPRCYDWTATSVFLNKPRVQARLGVSKKYEECDPLVYLLLLEDWITDLADKIGELLDAGFRVLLYDGDKDFVCNWQGGLDCVNAVDWSGADAFRNMQMKPWTPPGDNSVPAGELKMVKNFAFLRIYDAGHMVPMDKPEAALSMITEFLAGNLAPAQNSTAVVRVSHASGYRRNWDDINAQEVVYYE